MKKQNKVMSKKKIKMRKDKLKKEWLEAVENNLEQLKHLLGFDPSESASSAFMSMLSDAIGKASKDEKASLDEGLFLYTVPVIAGYLVEDLFEVKAA